MKRCFLLCTCLAACLCACQKSPSAQTPSGRSAHVTFTLTKASGPETRGTTADSADESAVNSLDAFVFNATGDLDAYGHYDAYDESAKPTLECTTGPGKRCYIVVNAQWNEATLKAQIATESDLNALVFTLESNGHAGPPVTLDHFEMLGNVEKDFVPGANDVSVSVSRVVARVKLGKITRDFSSEALNGEFKVKNLYMSNVVGSYGLDGTVRSGSGHSWYNVYADGSVALNAALNPWLNKALTAPVSIAEGSSATDGVASTFYVMPNDVDFDAPVGGDAWSPRHTKLVVETEYAGRTYYYAIPIVEMSPYPKLDEDDPGYADQRASFKGLKPNCSYEIGELVLTRLGSTNPDEPVMAAEVNFTISVADWDLVTLETENGKYVI